MRTLLIDNHDSFTFNLFQLLAGAGGGEPVVVRDDEASWEELAAEGFEAVVISPGPGRPERERDFGLAAAAIADFEGPLLGVCLGHQGIGTAAGAAVEPTSEPFHGRLSTVAHSGHPLFAGIPQRFEAVRYHSLALARPLPLGLEEIAWVAGDGDAAVAPAGEAGASVRGVPMAIAHRSRPQWGVQFHPESIAAEHGERLLRNFLALATSLAGATDRRSNSCNPTFVTHRVAKDGGSPGGAPEVGQGAGAGLRLKARRVTPAPDPAQVFAALYGASREAFWLDSAMGGGALGDEARFSFMGDASGPLAKVIEHRVGGEETIFDRLESELERLQGLDVAGAETLPFEFDCGLVGYLGYELKAECGGEEAHTSPWPDANLIFADRLLAFDHRKDDVYLLCLHEPDGDAEAAEWLAATQRRLSALSQPSPAQPDHRPEKPALVPPHLARTHEQHRADIAACQRFLRAGESYEICLTNSLRTETEADPLAVYRRLRRLNPAPRAAYLRFGELAVLSSSPERFLRVDRDGRAESKPIKGTAPRGATPAEDAGLAAGLHADEKSRAENLMIADLTRNDLGRVCAVGSVEVPALMAVESYATVHQLVTTVRGRLRPGLGAIDAIHACFPPGSMTGAPKQRTMAIIDRIEGAARGVYSGAIGWLGRGGACDLAVAIRTIVLDGVGVDELESGGGAAGPVRATIGSGGAIIAQSDPEAEYEEMLLKAWAPLRALGATASGPEPIDPSAEAPISLASAPGGSEPTRRQRQTTPTLTS